MEKLRAKLIEHNSRKEWFQNIERKFWFVRQGGDIGLFGKNSALDDILTGLLQEKRLLLQNEKFDGELESVTVAPLSMVLHQHQFYLLAKKADGVLHTFRLSRIRSAVPRERFEYPKPKAFSPERVFQNAFGIWVKNENPVEIEIHLSPRWRTFVSKHKWHSSQRVRPTNQKLELTVTCVPCPELEQWILSFGDEAEVVRPQDLRERIRAKAEGMARKYTAALSK
ncbi:MAG: WYL domain-containing protein [Archangium sp.]